MDDELKKAVEPEVRELLALVQELKLEVSKADGARGAAYELVARLERRLGGLLPPARGELRIELGHATVSR